jgi:hypothetical protein
MPAHHQIEETIDEYLSKVSIDDSQPLFQSVNKAGTALSGRALIGITPGQLSGNERETRGF